MTHTLVDCGCVARVHPDGSGVEIDFCPLHWAAPEILGLLEFAVINKRNFAEHDPDGVKQHWIELAATTVQKAKRKP